MRNRNVERIVIAFSNAPLEETLKLVRALKRLDIQIDIVPRLYEAVGPNVGVHRLESLPLVGLPAAKLFPFSRTAKRALDIVGASIGLLLTAPLLALFAWKIKRDSRGPILFRQTSMWLFIAAVVCGLLVFPVRRMMRGVPAGQR